MNKNNESLKEIFAKVIVNYKAKNYKNAEANCYKILGINPNHFDSVSMLATISFINRDYKKAEEFMHRAIEIEPENKTALHNLGTVYKDLQNFEEAKKYFLKVINIDPKHVNANYNLGLIYYKLRDLKIAKKYFQKTVDVQKNYALALFSLGNVNLEQKDFNEAISCYKKAIEINPNLVAAHNNLGLVFRTQNDFKNAIESYKMALKIKPEHAGAHHNLALAFKETGDFKKAIESHQNAIKYEPENLVHYHYLSELKKDILTPSLKKNIEKILKEKKCTNIVVAYGNYLLAEYEKNNKNFKEELDFLIKGHKSFFESKKNQFDLGIKYCFEDVLQITKEVKVSGIIKKSKEELKPIFIIGVPRCGSTLIEKIISSGKEFIPMGEETGVLENFINEKILKHQSLNIGDITDVVNELNAIYRNRGLVSKNLNYRMTDKSLNNFFYLDLIKSIYPNAKVINCKRNVLSSIMSILQNNLTDLAWAHNLDNIFKYFDNYFKCIEKFKIDNPDYLYDLEFDLLVNNPEEESKKLMSYCELPWDIKCLEFYKRKDLVSKTASNIQIRKAIYKHSLKKYLPYKSFLDEYGKKYSWYN